MKNLLSLILIFTSFSICNSQTIETAKFLAATNFTKMANNFPWVI